MPTCVIVLAESESANQLNQKLQKASTPLTKFQLVHPSFKKGDVLGEPQKETTTTETTLENGIRTIEINNVQLLNPKLSRQIRQRGMAMWLMPFGFLAGLTFTQMTGLETFESFGLGVGQLGEAAIGGLLGMGSGLLGSYVATASVNPPINEDIKSLRKKNEQGKWLLILETPFGIELPWQFLNEINPIEIINLND